MVDNEAGEVDVPMVRPICIEEHRLFKSMTCYNCGKEFFLRTLMNHHVGRVYGKAK